MSSISGVGYSPYAPTTNQVKKPAQAVPQQQPVQAVQPATKDADGDNDGSKGRFIDVKA